MEATTILTRGGFLHVIALPKRITESVEKVDREHDFVRSLQEIFNKK